MSGEIITCPNCSAQNRVAAADTGRPVCSQCWQPLKPSSPRPKPEIPVRPKQNAGASSKGANSTSTGCLLWILLAGGGLALLTLINREPSRSAPRPAPRAVDTRPSLVPQPVMNHGSHYNLTNRAAVAPFSISTSGPGYYYIKLVDAVSGKDAFVLFIHSGIPVEVDVPLGRYELRYAAGTTWYGIEHMFGYDTVYSKSTSPLDFTFDGSRYVGNSVTLYLVRNGNMRTTRINKENF